MRTLIIGDIHGCFDELVELVDRFGYQTGDKIIALGDIIGRGPAVDSCLDFLKEIQADCLLGNHEFWLLHEIETGEFGTEKSKCDYFSVDKHLEFIRSFRHYIENDDYIVVHAGFNPQFPLAKNSDEDLVSVRYLNRGYSKIPWFAEYCGDKHVYFGHWAALGFYRDENVTCLDGGCVYGNLLIGYCPEEGRFYTVKAKKAYQPIIYKPHKS